jgi:hypothetical protein
LIHNVEYHATDEYSGLSEPEQSVLCVKVIRHANLSLGRMTTFPYQNYYGNIQEQLVIDLPVFLELVRNLEKYTNGLPETHPIHRQQPMMWLVERLI